LKQLDKVICIPVQKTLPFYLNSFERHLMSLFLNRVSWLGHSRDTRPRRIWSKSGRPLRLVVMRVLRLPTMTTARPPTGATAARKGARLARRRPRHHLLHVSCVCSDRQDGRYFHVKSR
jgi:hypothetical protein